MKVVAWAITFFLVYAVSGAAFAYDAYPRRPTSLEGRWSLNTQQSEDAEAILLERIERERERYRKEMERYRRSRARADGDIPPVGTEGVDMPPATRAARERVKRRQEREMELYERMLNITRWLRITQQGTRIEISSAQETRRFDAGSESQVSMPEGQIADLRVGWDGEWFVIQRKVSRGPSAVERFRLLKKTDQLEYQMSWRGDTDLAGISVRRIFDRTTGEAPVRDPSVGPVR
jgi:hypothetical protein